MAEIIPIKGLRYNPERIINLAQVITPPYDVISAEEQQDYYQKSPYNIIRLEYGRVLPGDNEENNRYSRAANTLKNWRQAGILRREPRSVLYLYEQEYEYEGKKLVRTGLTGGVKLEPYAKKVIMPHEETFSQAKADRLLLLRHCRANFSPIFGLFAEEAGLLQSLWNHVKSKTPAVSFTDCSGQDHRLWLVDEPEIHQEVRQILRHKQIFIADGHHRYETALRFAQEQNWSKDTSHVLMTLVNLFDPGLIILPTHRLLLNTVNFNAEDFLHALAILFHLQEIEPRDPFQFCRLLNERGKRETAIGLYLNSRFYILVFKRRGEPPLDVSVLQDSVLKRILGIDENSLREGEALGYTRDPAAAVSQVDSRKARAAFFLNPTPVEQVIRAAEMGKKMPQKSTYFYPKLSTGLVINLLEP